MKRITHTVLAGLISLLVTAFQVQAAEVVTYYHNDHLGSPIAATDSSGAVVWEQAYDPWGETLITSSDERSYTGNWKDPATGLSDHQARWHSTSIGRFMAIDPVGFYPGNVQSFNRYAYGNNNPYSMVDPEGEYALPFILLGLGLLGGAIAVETGGWSTFFPATQGGADSYGGSPIDPTFVQPSPGYSSPDWSLPSWMSSDSSEETGSYVNGHESGTVYVGKGGRERSQESGRREERLNDDRHIWTWWEPAENDREAFKDESRKLDNYDGHRSDETYNRRNSPGRRYREQDGDE